MKKKDIRSHTKMPEKKQDALDGGRFARRSPDASSSGEQGKDSLSHMARGFLIVEGLFFVFLSILMVNTSLLPVPVMGLIFVVMGLGFTAQCVYFFSSQRKQPKKSPRALRRIFISTIVVSLCVVFCCTLAMYVLQRFYQTLISLNEGKTFVYIDLIVLEESPLRKLRDLEDGGRVAMRAYVDEESCQKALGQVQEKQDIVLNVDKYDDFALMIDSLYTKQSEILLINDSFLQLIQEQIDSSFSSKVRILHQVKVEVTDTEVYAAKDLTTQPFTFLISGVDNRSEVTEQGLSDVNILVSVNPVTHTVLMTNIPRDYYVALDGDEGKMDKLTHAGIYGVDCSVRTIEHLLGVEIDHYLKVGFYAVIDVVDALGGITVNSPYAFTTYDEIGQGGTVVVKKGENTFNGSQALAFSRERMSLPGGDRDRGKNQQLVIEAILQKILSPQVLVHFSGVMNALSEHCKMSFTAQEVAHLVQMQLSQGAEWTILSASVDGQGASRPSYSYGAGNLYVMIPDMSTVKNAKEQIKQVLTLPSAQEQQESRAQPGGALVCAPLTQRERAVLISLSAKKRVYAS